MRANNKLTARLTRFRGGLIAWICLLGACSTKAPAPPAKPVPAPPSLTVPYAAEARAGKAVYRLDSAKSRVWILVDKAGPLATFGHRHVIEVGRLEGFASVTPGAETKANLRFPVASLQVDRPAALKHFGSQEKIGNADRAGTREHMLGPRVLDAKRYPWVDLRINIADTRPGSRSLKAILQLHGKQKTLNLAANLTHPAQTWAVKGRFSIKQSQYGITPYSVMLGALRVKDKIEIRYDLVFTPWNP